MAASVPGVKLIANQIVHPPILRHWLRICRVTIGDRALSQTRPQLVPAPRCPIDFARQWNCRAIPALMTDFVEAGTFDAHDGRGRGRRR